MNRQFGEKVGVLTICAILLIGGILSGCQSAAKMGTSDEGAPEEVISSSDNSLAGTSWRLVDFQSMDDAIETVRPEDPSLYTMQLNNDGSVNMRLNCNRARGTWSAEPSSAGTSGSFTFGPLAMTRALCPPPSLDEKIAAQSNFIRTYLLKDGKLHLSLMADGGIYTWEPDTGDN